MQKPILLTGSHRSGTTWMGKIISSSKSIGYIMEPLNITDDYRPGLVTKSFDYWFQHINKENEEIFSEPIRKMLQFKYDSIAGLKSVRSPRSFAKLIRDECLCAKYRLTGARPFIKQPTAIFMAPWFSETFDSDVIVLIRHPAAFISSLKILGWTYDFNELLQQPQLMKGYLDPFNDEIIEYANVKKSIIDQAILLWKIIHYTIHLHQQKHDQWIYVRHEDISVDSIDGFRRMFLKLNIEFDSNVRKCIESYSSSSNPSDTTKAGLLLQTSRAIKRDSKSNILNWKKRLTDEEIEYIHNKVECVSKLFYTDNEW